MAGAIPDEVVRPYLNFLHASTLTGKPSRAQIAIAATIADAHMRTGSARFTYAQFAARASCTKRNAMRCVSRLVDAGFVRVLSRGEAGGNEYEPVIERGEEHDRAWCRWTADWSKGVRRDFAQAA